MLLFKAKKQNVKDVVTSTLLTDEIPVKEFKSHQVVKNKIMIINFIIAKYQNKFRKIGIVYLRRLK